MTTTDTDTDHQHRWGAVTVSRFTGTPSRPCLVDGCRVVSLDLSDDDEAEGGSTP